MSTNDDAGARAADGVDPRYDPAFQRGYRLGTARPESADAVAQAPAPDAVAQAAATPLASAASDGRRTPDRRQPGGSVPTGVPVDDSTGTSSGDQAEWEPVSHAPRANPYVTALWIIGIGFVVAGVGAQYWAQNSSANAGFDPSHGTPLVVVLASLAYSVGGPLITVGLATIVGLLFLAAVSSRPRPRSRRPR
ncbi:MAG: hypothetical protein EPN48_05060 [Microbacteriaceae bacterium]|nr:MAG: hypothetical protein EPN48_05060 [Microbacteriaceae bacterium]